MHAFTRGGQKNFLTKKQEPPVHIIPWHGEIEKSPWKIFLDLTRFSIDHGDEVEYYGEGLKALGWQKHPGVWVKNPGNQIVMMSHCDTVCRKTQPLTVHVSHGMATADEAAIGGDDRAGTSILLYLSRFRDDITYIITEGEEAGCVGFQEFLYDPYAEQLFNDPKKPVLMTISLDRKEYTNLVTHQMSDCLCSPAVAEEIEQTLLHHGLWYESDTTGAYTDSYQLVDFSGTWVVNMSVGYHDAHSAAEIQDLNYLNRLGAALRHTNWAQVLATCAEEGPRKEGYNAYRRRLQPDGSFKYNYKSQQQSGGYRMGGMYGNWGDYYDVDHRQTDIKAQEEHLRAIREEELEVDVLENSDLESVYTDNDVAFCWLCSTELSDVDPTLEEDIKRCGWGFDSYHGATIFVCKTCAVTYQSGVVG
jgi:hypothetical protein